MGLGKVKDKRREEVRIRGAAKSTGNTISIHNLTLLEVGKVLGCPELLNDYMLKINAEDQDIANQGSHE